MLAGAKRRRRPVFAGGGNGSAMRGDGGAARWYHPLNQLDTTADAATQAANAIEALFEVVA